MPPALALIALILTTAAADPEPAFAANPVYRELLEKGVDLGGTHIDFPAPGLRDGQSASSQRKVLEELAGGEQAAERLLRDSVTAPFVLKVRDKATPRGDPIRLADLVFVVHADLDAVDPGKAARESAGKATEVANMRVETTLLGDDDLKAANVPPAEAGREWYAHLSARLLDRIAVEVTDHAVLTRSAESLVVASRTDSRFDRGGRGPNVWTPLARDGTPAGKPKPYEGGASYVKVSRLADAPGTLVVEAHFAFVEPRGWFDGAPILRSKFAPIAQDQIRSLRRDAKRFRR